MLSNALQVVITSLFMSVTISVSMSVFMSVPFRFHARPKIVLLDVDDFRGQMGDRPFDEDKSAVCGRDCVGRCGPPYKDGLWISGLGLSVTSCCDARDSARSLLRFREKIRSRLRTEHEAPFRLEAPVPDKRAL